MPAPKPAAPTDREALSIPSHLCAPPVSEARRSETAPRLPRLALLTLIARYASAAAAARTHLTAAGWRLALVMTALIGYAAATVRHGCRIARYRSEAPR